MNPINAPAGAITTPTELPPVHPDCKVFPHASKLQARAHELHQRGDWLACFQLVDALRSALFGTNHRP